MQRLIGKILIVLGWVCTVWFGLVGGSFSFVYLTGFVGTAGREAGGELVFALFITLVGVAVGLALVRVGSWLVTCYDNRTRRTTLIKDKGAGK